MNESDQVFAGLDIGSTKVSVVIGEMIGDGLFQVYGGASVTHDAINNGAILRIAELIDAIREALDRVVNETGRSFKWVMVGFSARSVNCINSKGVTLINGRNGITQAEIDAAVRTAIADSAIPVDRKSLHIIPRYYRIDKEHRVEDPIGMSGRNLEVYIHTITCAFTDYENIFKCVQCPELRLNLKGMMLNSYIASKYVLRDDEKDLGVLYIDMGSDFTDFIAYEKNKPYCTGVLPVGGRRITERIHDRMNVQTKGAEELKLNHGRAYANESEQEEWFYLPREGQGNDLEFRQYAFSALIQEVVEGIFGEILQAVTQRDSLAKIRCGVVLSGGSSKLRGIADCARHVFRLPARIGKVEQCEFETEELDGADYVNAIALSKYAAGESSAADSGLSGGRSGQEASLWSRFWANVKEFF